MKPLISRRIKHSPNVFVFECISPLIIPYIVIFFNGDFFVSRNVSNQANLCIDWPKGNYLKGAISEAKQLLSILYLVLHSILYLVPSNPLTNEPFL